MKSPFENLAITKEHFEKALQEMNHASFTVKSHYKHQKYLRKSNIIPSETPCEN